MFLVFIDIVAWNFIVSKWISLEYKSQRIFRCVLVAKLSLFFFLFPSLSFFLCNFRSILCLFLSSLIQNQLKEWNHFHCHWFSHFFQALTLFTTCHPFFYNLIDNSFSARAQIQTNCSVYTSSAFPLNA